MPFTDSAHKAKAKMDVLALINQNYLLTRAGLWEHHSCNGYISKRLKGLASVELTDCGQFIIWSEGTIQYLYLQTNTKVNSPCMLGYACAHALFVVFFQQKYFASLIRWITEFHYAISCLLRCLCVFHLHQILNQFPVIYYSRSVGLTCCYINVDFKTLFQFISYLYYSQTLCSWTWNVRPCPFSCLKCFSLILITL